MTSIREDPLKSLIDDDWKTCGGTEKGLDRASFDLAFRLGWHAHWKVNRIQSGQKRKYDDGTNDIS
jgi:hypothetical protein